MERIKMLEVENIVKKFGDKIAVNNVNFTINPGEILGILGTNGAGKTTIFRMILGIFEPEEGSIKINGEQITIGDSKDIGFLPEERSLLSKFTIKEQLLFFGELKGKKPKELEPKIIKWLEYFDLSEHLNSQIKELSKGNQQKIQYISAVLHEPNLIILDEPFSGLDPLNIKLIKDSITELRKQGAMIIFSSHRLDYVESFAKNVIVLDHGVPYLSGNIDSIKQEGNEYIVEIESLDNLDFLNQQPYVLNLESNLDTKYKVTISGYENVDKLFNQLSSLQIRGFNVQLPSLEDLVIKAVGGKNE